MESCVQGCLFSSIFCVTKTCYVAMPSGYKLDIHVHSGCMAHISLSPRGLRPHASVQYMPYIPRARVITITRGIACTHVRESNPWVHSVQKDGILHTCTCMTSLNIIIVLWQQ